MARFRLAVGLARRASNGRPPGPVARGLRLSWRGRLLGTALLLPGVAAVVAAPFLPTSARSGSLSAMNLTLAAGILVVLTAYPSALLHAFWTRSLRAVPDSPSWSDAHRPHPDGGAVAIVVGLVLALANLTAAALFGLLARRVPVELAATVLFLVAAVLHLVLTVTRRRYETAPSPPLRL
jgi:hypothetical protein